MAGGAGPSGQGGSAAGAARRASGGAQQAAGAGRRGREQQQAVISLASDDDSSDIEIVAETRAPKRRRIQSQDGDDEPVVVCATRAPAPAPRARAPPAPTPPSPPKRKGLECVICMDEMKDACVTPCGHMFCHPCIQDWLRRQPTAGAEQCPQCRKQVPREPKTGARGYNKKHAGLPYMQRKTPTVSWKLTRVFIPT